MSSGRSSPLPSLKKIPMRGAPPVGPPAAELKSKVGGTGGGEDGTPVNVTAAVFANEGPTNSSIADVSVAPKAGEALLIQWARASLPYVRKSPTRNWACAR